jgi:hypothetical protein
MQWPVASGQWPVVSGQWSVVSGQWIRWVTLIVFLDWSLVTGHYIAYRNRQLAIVARLTRHWTRLPGAVRAQF